MHVIFSEASKFNWLVFIHPVITKLLITSPSTNQLYTLYVCKKWSHWFGHRVARFYVMVSYRDMKGISETEVAFKTE